MQCFIQALLDSCACVRLFSDIGHVIPKINWEVICISSRRKFKHAYSLLGLINMMTSESVKSETNWCRVSVAAISLT